MRTFKLIALTVLLLLAGTAGPLAAQARNAQDRDDACRNFVQSFYNWYTPVAMDDTAFPAAMGLTIQSQILSPDLARLLEEIGAAAINGGGEIFLGVDPIVNSQDLWKKFMVGDVTRKGDHCFAEVYGVSLEKKDRNPDVVAELIFQSGRWTFVNFHYPGYPVSSGNENLLSVLRRIQRSIQPQDSRPEGIHTAGIHTAAVARTRNPAQ
jgi:hypothetical protein